MRRAPSSMSNGAALSVINRVIAGTARVKRRVPKAQADQTVPVSVAGVNPKAATGELRAHAHQA